MRVWVYPEKTYEDLGAKRWQVEWYTVGAKAKARVASAEARGEIEDLDPDRDIVTNCKVFPHAQKAKALKFAERMAVCEDSAYGCATVTEEVVDWYVEEDRVAEWTAVGEPIYVP